MRHYGRGSAWKALESRYRISLRIGKRVKSSRRSTQNIFRETETSEKL